MAAPQDWLIEDHKGLFGKGEVKQWREAGSFFEQAERFAAARQDAVSRMMRAAMKDRGLTGEDLSVRLGKNRAHVGRKLRGEEWLGWREVHEWALVVGCVSLLTVHTGDGDAGDLSELLGRQPFELP